MGAFGDYTLTGASAVHRGRRVTAATHDPSGRSVMVTEAEDGAPLAERAIERVRATESSLASVDHPAVQGIDKVIEEDGRFWVVEERSGGRELGEVAAGQALTAEQVALLAVELLRGLAAVQEAGVVHGDLSTANVVVGDDGSPLIVGFGWRGEDASPGDDVAAVATLARDLLPAAAERDRPRKLEVALEGAVSGDPKHRPADAATLLTSIEKAARSDFGRGWDGRTSLAAMVPAAASGDGVAVETAPEDDEGSEDVDSDHGEAGGSIDPDDATEVADAPDGDVTNGDVTNGEAANEDATEAGESDEAAYVTDATGDDDESLATEVLVGLQVPMFGVPSEPTKPADVPAKRTSRRAVPRAAKLLVFAIVVLVVAGGVLAIERSRDDAGRTESAEGTEVDGSDPGSDPGAGGSSEGSGEDPGEDPGEAPPGPTDSEVALSDITGTWVMTLVVEESTGFFNAPEGSSGQKVYVISPSDCSVSPCRYVLEVADTGKTFGLLPSEDSYRLSATEPTDCVNLDTNELRVPAGGLGSVQMSLRPTAATLGPDGVWDATRLTGSVTTTFDTDNPDCTEGSGVQRSRADGTRQ